MTDGGRSSFTLHVRGSRSAFCLAGRPPGYGGDRRVGLVQRLRCPGGWITALGGQRQAMHERPGQRQGDSQQQPHPQAPGEKCPHAQGPFVVPREVPRRYPPCPGLTTFRAACCSSRTWRTGGVRTASASTLACRTPPGRCRSCWPPPCAPPGGPTGPAWTAGARRARRDDLAVAGLRGGAEVDPLGHDDLFLLNAGVELGETAQAQDGIRPRGTGQRPS